MAVLRPTGKTVTVCRRCIAVESLQRPHSAALMYVGLLYVYLAHEKVMLAC